MTNNPLKCVVLVDDNAPDNFVHRRMLARAGIADTVNEFEYAEDALRFLRSPDRPAVDLLIVDINMPRMDGYQFAEEYRKLFPELKAKMPMVILTSSVDPSDEFWTQSHPEISGLVRKPLEIEALEPFVRKTAEESPAAQHG
ncbi:MAG: response regulator [Pseudomonadota bacterium]